MKEYAKCGALANASAIVHHGGIGTAGCAIQEGVPQLIVPRVFGQPSNAEWLKRLGLCIVLEPWNYTVQMAVRSLQTLLKDDTYARRARDCSSLFDPHTEVQNACNLLESCKGSDTIRLRKDITIKARSANQLSPTN